VAAATFPRCTALLDVEASVAAVDGDGCTPLHSACVDLHLASERRTAGLICDPEAVVALLLK
jgi:hypothetical protein